MSIRRTVAAFALVSALGAIPTVAEAVPFEIRVDTSTLTLDPFRLSAPFSAFFQLLDGSGVGDGSSRVALTEFAFDGGTFGSGPATFGGASGDLGSRIDLVDDSFFSSFSQEFTPGTTLTFHLDVTTLADMVGVPDTFAFSILDSSGFPIPTEDPSLADTLIVFTLGSTGPAFISYQTDLSRTAISISAPEIDSGVTPVPEPGTFSLFALGSAAFAAIRARRRRKTSQTPSVAGL